MPDFRCKCRMADVAVLVDCEEKPDTQTKTAEQTDEESAQTGAASEDVDSKLEEVVNMPVRGAAVPLKSLTIQIEVSH